MKNSFILLCIAFWGISPQVSFAQFALGSDIGWLSEMEASGRKFYNKSGQQQDLLDILKFYNINSVRFRVWVKPAAGYCNKADVIKQALRAKNKGFRIMIDFHYSDSWADPGQQNKPADWSSYTIAQLKTAVSTHTKDVLAGLRDAGVTPEWVQVGNETNNGMLWDQGRASTNMGNFAQLVTSGYDAVKSVFPNAKVLVHISNGYDNSLFRWMFDGLKNNNAKWDVIAMSMYPEQDIANRTWQQINPLCLTNMNDMVARYGKEIMIAEIGMPWSDANASYDFIKDIIAKTKSVDQNKGLGVFYWEPQCYNGWNGYQKGAFDNSGKPTHAMDAFLDNVVTDIEEASIADEIIKIHPNPSNSYFEFATPSIADVKIYTATGVLKEQLQNASQFKFGDSYPSGMYWLHVKTLNTIHKVKIIKE